MQVRAIPECLWPCGPSTHPGCTEPDCFCSGWVLYRIDSWEDLRTISPGLWFLLCCYQFMGSWASFLLHFLQIITSRQSQCVLSIASRTVENLQRAYMLQFVKQTCSEPQMEANYLFYSFFSWANNNYMHLWNTTWYISIYLCCRMIPLSYLMYL